MDENETLTEMVKGIADLNRRIEPVAVMAGRFNELAAGVELLGDDLATVRKKLDELLKPKTGPKAITAFDEGDLAKAATKVTEYLEIQQSFGMSTVKLIDTLKALLHRESELEKYCDDKEFARAIKTMLLRANRITDLGTGKTKNWIFGIAPNT